MCVRVCELATITFIKRLKKQKTYNEIKAMNFGIQGAYYYKYRTY